MPTSLKVQSLLPRVGQIVACSGMLSPIFHPNCFASDSPTTAPMRSELNALSCSGGSTYSGYSSMKPGPMA